MRRIIQYSIVAVALLIGGCKNEEMIGPRIVNLYAPFEVTEHLSVSNTAPDFSGGSTVNIKAKFDKYASWKLTITGRKTKTTKVFTGESPEVDITWDGSADNLPFFDLETCDLSLIYPNFSDKPADTTSLTIKGVYDPDKNGIIITNFKVSRIKEIYNGAFGDTTKWESDYNPTSTASSNPIPADGNPYLFSTVALPGPSTPYLDQLNIYANASDIAYGKYWPLVSDPKRVYFNVMVYCSLVDTSHYKDARLEFTFTEEGGNTATARIQPDWEGWQIKSFSYASMEFKDKDALPRPDRIRKVSIVFLTTAAVPDKSIRYKTAYDHLIWTLDKPYGSH